MGCGSGLRLPRSGSDTRETSECDAPQESQDPDPERKYGYGSHLLNLPWKSYRSVPE